MDFFFYYQTCEMRLHDCFAIVSQTFSELPVFRSVLLASGTLAPLASFAAELMLPFPNRLENPHVIDTTRQVLAGVVAKGVTGHSLNSSYQVMGLGNVSITVYHL